MSFCVVHLDEKRRLQMKHTLRFHFLQSRLTNGVDNAIAAAVNVVAVAVVVAAVVAVVVAVVVVVAAAVVVVAAVVAVVAVVVGVVVMELAALLIVVGDEVSVARLFGLWDIRHGEDVKSEARTMTEIVGDMAGSSLAVQSCHRLQPRCVH